jgi:cysteine-rich repeat protein
MNNQKNSNAILSIMIALAVVGISSSANAGQPIVCGDGVEEGLEECDDGNLVNGDGCDKWCKKEDAVCGNDVKEAGEECDDGNLVNGDGCDKWCELERPVCGNDMKEAGEECDDGNTVNGDGCDEYCKKEDAVCGNDVKEAGEECDDGNLVNGDGCDKWCKKEEAVCGNDVKEAGEECDDGNLVNGDGCDKYCKDECKKDGDYDGVKDCDDMCPGTKIPEDVPTSGVLNPNHSALTKKIGDPYKFTTAPPKGNGNGPGNSYTIKDTGGCSCDQILDELGLGDGQRKHGCSPGTMKNWVQEVEDAQPAPIGGGPEWDDLEPAPLGAELEVGDLEAADPLTDSTEVDVPGAPEMGCSMGGETRHAPAWAFLGLMFAAVGLRRRS